MNGMLCCSELFLIWEHFHVSTVNFTRITLSVVGLTMSVLCSETVQQLLRGQALQPFRWHEPLHRDHQPLSLLHLSSAPRVAPSPGLVCSTRSGLLGSLLVPCVPSEDAASTNPPEVLQAASLRPLVNHHLMRRPSPQLCVNG